MDDHVCRLELVGWSRSLCTFGVGIVVTIFFVIFCLSVSAVLSLVLFLGIRISDGV